MPAYIGSWHHYGAIMSEPRPTSKLSSKIYESKAPPMPTVWPNNQTSQDFVNVTPQTTVPPCLYELRLANQDLGSILFILFVPVTCIIVILGLINNSLCYIIMRKFNKKSTPNFVMRVLAVADNMVLFSLILYNTLPATYEYTGHLLDYYQAFQHMKGYLWFFMWFSKTFSVYIIVLMTVDRYIALCHPLKAQRLCTRKKAWFGVVSVIIFSVLYNLPKLWYLKIVFKYDPCSSTMKPTVILSDTYSNPYFQHIYIQGAYILVMFVVPLHVLLILNIFLVNAIRKATKNRQTMNSTGKKGRDSVTERIIGVVTMFIVLESPSIIANVLITVNQWADGKLMDYEALHWGARIGYVLSAINSFINFYIYVLVGKRFRRHFLSLFHRNKESLNDSLMSGQQRSVSHNNGRHLSRQTTRDTILNGNNAALAALLIHADGTRTRSPSVSPQTPKSSTPKWPPESPRTPRTGSPRHGHSPRGIPGMGAKKNLFFSSRC
ncbi:FMRFamide receptor-like isoform X2 [Lineus longissimus]